MQINPCHNYWPRLYVSEWMALQPPADAVQPYEDHPTNPFWGPFANKQWGISGVGLFFSRSSRLFYLLIVQ